jgi:alpha-ketoglutarate-dependent taurine dioxygenase
MTVAFDFEVRQVSAVAGAEVVGLDLGRSLDDDAVEAINEALVKHHILIFRDQALSAEQQLDFTRRFGELEEHVIRLANGEKAPLLHVISNLDAAGQPTSKPYSHGNYYWHTDKSYHAKPSFATLLHAVEIPPKGGDTQYANLHRAYDALSSQQQADIADLQLEHSWEASRLNTGNRPATEDEKRDRPPVIHPLVRTHPETGNKSLYMGAHVSHVLGMERDASRHLLEELTEIATRSEHIYAHEWQAGDLVMWDNRSLMHKATANFDMDAHRRVLHRTVVRGTVPY